MLFFTGLVGAQSQEVAPTFLQADRISGRSGAETVMEGDALLRKPGLVIQADQLEYDQLSDRAKATGNVRIQRKGARYEGTAGEVTVDAMEGFMDNMRYEFEQNGSHGEALRAEFADETHSTLFQTTYTTCRRDAVADWTPAWVVRAGQLDLDNDEDIGTAQSAYLEFKSVPILPIPPMGFPLSDKRKSGFLPPTLGLDNTNGLEVVTPYYWNIAPNRDATISPTLMASRGVNLMGEYRYLEPDYLGVVKTSVLPNDPLRGADRWGLALKHQDRLDAQQGAVGWALNLNRVSDDNYWRDFSGQYITEGGTLRLLPSQLNAAWGSGYFSSTMTVQKWQVLQDSNAFIIQPYERLPQITGRYARINDGGWDWSIDGDFTRFSSYAELTGQPNADRGVLWGQVSRPWLAPQGYITPKMQFHAAAYQYENLTYYGSNGATSSVPTFNLDSGLVFERESRWGNQSIVQTLEPRAFYVYTPYHQQYQLPNYDTGVNDFNFASIYLENAFSGHDKVSDNNLLTMGLTSRFLDRESGAQFARLGFAQRLRFEDQNVGISSSTAAKAGFSDLLLGGAVNLNERWAFDTLLQYNTLTNQSVRSTAGARYSPGPYQVLNVSYRLTRDTSELIDTSVQWPLGKIWPGQAQNDDPAGGKYYGLARANYSMYDNRMVDTLMGLEYDAGCWLGRVVLQRSQLGINSAVQSVFFQLEFVGFSKVGISPEKALANSIPRYQPLRGTP
jgi:LPS-assembly protein